MYVAIRDAIVSWLGYKDLIAGVKDLELKSLELAVGKDLKTPSGFDLSTDRGRQDAIRRLEAEDLQICALLVSQDFAKEDVEPEIKWVVDACKTASSLGVDAVRIDVPGSRSGLAVKQAAELTAKCTRQIIERTKGLGVALGMENHGVIGNTREFIRGVLEAVGSERLGLTLDAGNFYWYGYRLDEVYEIVETFAPYVKHTHFKNLSFSEERRKIRRKPGEDYPKSAAPLHRGDIDVRRVVDMLKKAGYDKDLTIEDESLDNFPREQRLGIVKEEVRYMKSMV